eukprot:12923415-Alexandrium_andersonii.AAC.1
MQIQWRPRKNTFEEMHEKMNGNAWSIRSWRPARVRRAKHRQRLESIDQKIPPLTKPTVGTDNEYTSGCDLPPTGIDSAPLVGWTAPPIR